MSLEAFIIQRVIHSHIGQSHFSGCKNKNNFLTCNNLSDYFIKIEKPFNKLKGFLIFLVSNYIFSTCI